MSERPVIVVHEAELHALADDAWNAIAKDNDPPRVFVRGRSLVQVASDGQGDFMLAEFNSKSLRDLMSQTAGWRGAKGKVVFPPKDVADVLLERDVTAYKGAPVLDRIVSVPVFGRDGSLMTTPGYHPEARVYYSPGPGLEKMREVTGSSDDVREAVAWVRGTLFAEFPFVEDADFAHAVALFLLPFARDLIGGLTPMHPVIAPTPGSGKDALIDVALRPSCGSVGKTAELKSDEEMRKQITAHLLAGTSAFVFDNIKSSLDSGALAAALTADVWQDRILGYSKTVSLPVRNVWALTANNLQTTAEQARRMVPIFLDASMERPDKRTFKRDLDTWIPQHRAEAVWAALTIIKSWLDAEDPLNRDHLNLTYDSTAATFSPLRGTRLKNSYAEWSRVMGGILEWIEVPGFLANCDKMFMYVEDEAGDDIVDLLAAWHARYPEPYSTKDLMEKLWDWNGGLIEYLPAALRDVRHEQRSNNLGQVLRHNADRVHGGYKIIKHEGRPRKWQVVKVNP